VSRRLDAASEYKRDSNAFPRVREQRARSSRSPRSGASSEDVTRHFDFEQENVEILAPLPP
jgi:hypothetical protein